VIFIFVKILEHFVFVEILGHFFFFHQLQTQWKKNCPWRLENEMSSPYR